MFCPYEYTDGAKRVGIALGIRVSGLLVAFCVPLCALRPHSFIPTTDMVRTSAAHESANEQKNGSEKHAMDCLLGPPSSLD